MLISNGAILALGKEDAYPQLAGRSAEKIDLNGRHVLPAFTDAHTHLIMSALNFYGVDLRPARSLKSALNILQAHTSSIKKNEWVLGFGFNRNLWDDGQPTRHDLDRIFPKNPVLLDSIDYHTIWVNSRTLHLSGINQNTPDPPGGKIDREADHQPKGLLSEEAVALIKNILPDFNRQQKKRAVLKLIKQLHAKGISAVHTMEGVDEYKLLKDLDQNDKLKLRVHFYIPHREMDWLIRQKWHSGSGSDWLRIGGIKVFADGSLGSQTAEMRTPYENDADNLGIAHLSEEDLLNIISKGAENGLSPAVHAIGDRAVQKVLNVFEQIQSWRAQWNLILRMEHAQLVPPESVSLFKQFGVIASMQPIHIADDVRIAEKFWGKRSAYAYAMKPLLQAGAELAFGSDTPVADFDPIKGIYSAVNRRYHLDPRQPRWQPQLAISTEQAIRAYIIGGAKATNDLHRRGTLTPGKVADFIVLNKDPFSLKNDEILSLKVLQTFINGEIVYQKTT